MAGQLTQWWFWVLLPVGLVAFGLLDRRLASYSRRYWRGRGEPQPEHRWSYANAGRLVLYSVTSAVAGVVLLVDGNVLWGALCAVGVVAFAWLAVVQARRNVI